MPLNERGQKLRDNFREQYGEKKGDSIFYAMENSGKLKKVIKAKGGKDASQPDFGGGSKGTVDGRNPSLQYETKTNLSKDARDRLESQRARARTSISPSTSYVNQAVKLGLNLAVPGLGSIYGKGIDSRAMGFSSSTSKGKKNGGDKTGADNMQKTITPIEATKPIDKTLIDPKKNFFNFVAYKVGGLSGGVRYGPPPKRGPNPQVPPVKMKKGGHK